MQFSFEVPYANLNLGISHSDFLFVLPQLYLQDYRYRDFVNSYSGLKYLDNGAYELGEPLDLPLLVDVAVNIHPEVLVVPDVLGSMERTVKVARQFFSRFRRSYLPRTKLMVVAQGRDTEERLRCLLKLKRFGRFEMIGLPRIAYPRTKLFKIVANKFKKEIHLLGCPDPLEIREITQLKNPYLVSLDTSWVARDALGIGEARKLDFENDVLDEEAFLRSYEKFFRLIGGGEM